MPRLRLLLTTAVACVALLAAAARPATAQQPPPGPPAAAAPPDAAAVEEARRHFATGQKLFDAGNLKGAVEELKEAYRLSRNPLLLYNIGVVYDKLGDAPLALHYFQRFIDDQKDTEKTHDRLVEASRRAAELRKQTGEEPGATPVPTQPAAPAPPALTHEPIEQAPPGRPIDVTARAPEEAGWIVTLYHRHAGEDLYQQVRMKARPGLGTELVGRIPAASVQGRALHYYLAARDGEGKVVAWSGRAATPNIVTLDRAAPLHAFVMPGDEPDAVPALPSPAPAPAAEPAAPRSPLLWAKWGTSGGALVLVGVGVGFSLAARSYAETLQAEAIKSSSGECAPDPPPCRVFSTPRKELERTGLQYERWGTVALVGGAAAAVAAGVLWYLDSREQPVATPVVGPGTVGAAATVRF